MSALGLDLDVLDEQSSGILHAYVQAHEVLQLKGRLPKELT